MWDKHTPEFGILSQQIFFLKKLLVLLLTLCFYSPYMWAVNLASHYLLKFGLINVWFSLSLLCFCGQSLPKCICVNEVCLHLWCSLKFLQDMTILHSFCSLSMVMALLCVNIMGSLLHSQQSYIVSLFSMLNSILCKNLAVIRKMLPSLWPLLTIWSVISGRESKPLHGGKENR